MGTVIGNAIGVPFGGAQSWSSWCTQLITVGVGKDYATITEAINAASNGNQILIDAGNYNEVLDLTSKRLKLIGSGTLGTIVHFVDVSQASVAPTVDIAKNCAFENIVFDRTVTGGSYPPPIVNVSACIVNFLNCKVGQSNYTDGYKSQNPMTIQNGAVVNMVGSEIAKNHILFPNASDLIVKDTSVFNFEGTAFHAHLWAQDTAEVHITTDYLYVGTYPQYQPGIYATNYSRVYLNIRTEMVGYNPNSVAAYELLPVGQFGCGYVSIDHAYCEVTGKINGSFMTEGGGAEIKLKGAIATEGQVWYLTEIGDADGDVCTIEDCDIYFDCNDAVHGVHILESLSHAAVNIINSRLEFSGFNGKWHTMGSVGGCFGKLTMRDSEVIDNCNDNTPIPNYVSTLTQGAEIDIEDSILTNQNWDHVVGSEAVNMKIKKLTGQHLKVRLKNVVFNNECDAIPICFEASNSIALDANDWMTIENITNNTTKDLFMVDYRELNSRTRQQDMIVYATLRSQYPDKIVDLAAPAAPTLTAITKGVRVSWTDTTKETEIWAYNNTDAPTLVMFCGVGEGSWDEVCHPATMRHYYIRQVDGIHYSTNSAVANIALTEIEQIDQTLWCEVGLAWWTTCTDFVGNGSSITGTSQVTLLIPGSTGKKYRIAITRTATLEIWWNNFLGYISDATPTREVVADGDILTIHRGGAVTITAISVKEIIP
jgi:hypothetical protein